MMKNIYLVIITIAICSLSCAQNKIKVACIGNSITAGYGIKKEQAYPAQLQQLLGDSFEVQNYGVSSRTLLTKGDHPYIKEAAYTQALNWQPNIVIVKLGTNDSKPFNWKYKDEFMMDYTALINSFKTLPSHPTIFICYPVPVFKEVPGFHAEWGITDSIVSKEVMPLIKKVSEETNSALIDLYQPLLGKSNLFYDGIHPNPEGAKVIAKEVYKVLVEKGILKSQLQ